MGSNGLASGNVLIEAIIHGLCEVIERDATTLHYLSLQVDGEAAGEKAGIDLSTIDDPRCREALRRFDAAGILVRVTELTSDVGVPVFECVIVEQHYKGLHTLYPTAGFGCHPVREIALLRALTEAAQSRVTMIAGTRDDAVREHYEASSDPEFFAQYTKALAIQKCPRSFCNVPTRVEPTFESELQHLVASLAQVGLREVIAVDLTKPEFGVPVVRVVVPGLETAGPGTHHRFREYTPGSRARAILSKGQNIHS